MCQIFTQENSSKLLGKHMEERLPSFLRVKSQSYSHFHSKSKNTTNFVKQQLTFHFGWNPKTPVKEKLWIPTFFFIRGNMTHLFFIKDNGVTFIEFPDLDFRSRNISYELILYFYLNTYRPEPVGLRHPYFGVCCMAEWSEEGKEQGLEVPGYSDLTA